MKCLTMKKTVIIIFYILIANNIYATNTNTVDSLFKILETEKIDTSKVTILNEISQEYLKTDFNKAYEYANKALSLAKKINIKKSIALSYTYIAYSQYRLNKFEDAKININKTLVIYEILNDKLHISKCYSFISQIHYALQEYTEAIKWVKKSITIKLNNQFTNELEINYLTLGAIYEKQSKYKLALENFFKAIEFYDKNGKQKSKASVFNNIAITYRRLRNNDLAEEYYKKSLNLYKQNNNKFGELKIYNNLAVLYEKQDMQDKAINNYLKALKLSKEVDFNGGIAMSQINIAGIYIEQNKNLDEAKKFLSSSEKICTETKDNYKLSTLYGLKGQLFEKQGNIKKSIFFTKKGYDLSIKINDLKNTSEMAIQLSKFYKKQNDYRNSLKYFEIYHSANDSIYNIKKTTAIEEIKTKFDTENKEKELKIKQKEIKVLKKQEEIDNIKSYAWLIVKILIFVIIIFAILFLRKQLKKQKRISEKNKKVAETEKRLLELEILTKKQRNEQLENEVEYKNKELQNFAQYIIDKNEFITKIQHDLKKAKKNISEKNIDNSLQSILIDINNKIQIVRNNEEFLAHVDQINNNFYFKLKEKFPNITENEQRLASLLKIGLSSKEIASILHITPKSVDTNRYRLRKKLELNQDINLHEYFLNL